jgi:hypothetical protein
MPIQSDTIRQERNNYHQNDGNINYSRGQNTISQTSKKLHNRHMIVDNQENGNEQLTVSSPSMHYDTGIDRFGDCMVLRIVDEFDRKLEECMDRENGCCCSCEF